MKSLVLTTLAAFATSFLLTGSTVSAQDQKPDPNIDAAKSTLAILD